MSSWKVFRWMWRPAVDVLEKSCLRDEIRSAVKWHSSCSCDIMESEAGCLMLGARSWKERH